MPRPSGATKVLSDPTLLGLPRLRLGTALVTIGTGIGCFVAQWVGVILWVPPAQLSAIWIPGGLMLAVTLLAEPRRWPALVTAAATGSTLLLVAVRVFPPVAAIAIGLLAGVQTIAIASALRAVHHRPRAFTTLLELLSYLGVTAGVSIVGATLFLGALWSFDVRPATFSVWRTVALSVMLGYVTVTPSVILLAQEAKALWYGSVQRRLEGSLITLLLVFACGLVFTGVVSRTVTWTAFLMTLPPLLLWSAMRFGRLGASASLLLVSLISTASTSHGLGPFAAQSPGDNTLSLQLFILGLGLPLLGLAVTLHEQQRTKAALQWSHARLRGLNRELIAAREEEATRIARELHDDVGQRLALVSIGLSRLHQARAEAIADGAEIVKLQQQTNSIVASLRHISRQLYPAALQHAGLFPSLRLLCEEVQQATELELHVAYHGDIPAIPRDAALCLYRVAQEALNNIVRHARARRVDLLLRHDDTHLILQITDNGRGFASDGAELGPGLGVRYAAERVRSVGGILTVKSAPGAGTTVQAAIPLRRAIDA